MERLAVGLLFAALHLPLARASTPEPVPEGLRGCVEQDIEHSGWMAICEGMVLGVSDGPADGKCTTTECLEQFVTGVASTLGPAPLRSDRTLPVTGVARRVVQFDGIANGKWPVRVLMAVIDRVEGRRFLVCLASEKDEDRCSAAFEAMATLPWHSAIPEFLKPARP